MPQFKGQSNDSAKSQEQPDSALSETSQKLYREAEMISLGVGRALLDTAKKPLDKLPELTTSLATGVAFGAISRLGAPGKLVAAGVGTAMATKFAYDELTGKRWSQFGGALKDTWHTGANKERNIEVTKNSLGSFVVDTGVGAVGMKFGSLATARFAPPSLLVKGALSRADSDSGMALRSLQNRWEAPARLQKQAAGKIELIAHTEPAIKGAASGDLIRVAKTRDGEVLIAAMDVEGHGLNAAKKAVSVHAAIDKVLPETRNRSASDILGMIDQRLNAKDELSITAALLKYDPATGKLQTATASSEFAFVVRANGVVKQLDAEVGGLGLGTDMYASFPKGNEVIRLSKGDTVVLASDGAFDRFGYGKVQAFQQFLEKTGPKPEQIRQGILNKPQPEAGADDMSFIIFRPVE
ncbi:MAG: PP2C family protein-serine/threonine phosphatase [Candidatus Obscuribacterales bacterium]